MRIYLPRVFGALEPLRELHPFTDIIEMPATAPGLVPYGNPEVRNALRALLDAGEEADRWAEVVGECNREAMAQGLPLLGGGLVKAPFDTIGDTLRGTRGVMMDIYRQPDKLLKALERIVPLEISRGVSA